MRVRPAVRADFIDFYGSVPPMTVKALTAVDVDDKPMAIGGYYLLGGVALAFTDNREGMRKRDLVRCARELMKLLKRLRCDVYAQGSPEFDTALRHFGFRPSPRLRPTGDPEGDLYRLEKWQD